MGVEKYITVPESEGELPSRALVSVDTINKRTNGRRGLDMHYDDGMGG